MSEQDDFEAHLADVIAMASPAVCRAMAKFQFALAARADWLDRPMHISLALRWQGAALSKAERREP